MGTTIRCVEHTGKAKHITPFVGAKIDIVNAFGFKIPYGCAPKYTSREHNAAILYALPLMIITF